MHEATRKPTALERAIALAAKRHAGMPDRTRDRKYFRWHNWLRQREDVAQESRSVLREKPQEKR